MSDLAEIARALDPKAKRESNGSWLCRCPAHDDGHPSLSLSIKDGRLLWCCHAGCAQADVQAELRKRGLLGKPNGAEHSTTKPQAKADDWRPIVPVPDDAAEPAFTHLTYGKPSATWTYRDGEGRVLFHVARFDPPDDRKQVLPLCWGARKGKLGWYWHAPAEPRPLYRLDLLADRPADPVLVVEGEKTADAAAEILPDYVATTWQGGARATGKADWSALEGRTAAVWPDHDQPGRKAAELIGAALREVAAEVRIVDLPPDLPEGWDLADPAPDGLDVRGLLGHAAAREEPPASETLEQAIERLARLSPGAYKQARRGEAAKLNVRASILDALVKGKRAAIEPAAADGQGRPVELADIEPWPEPVHGAALIGDLVSKIRAFVSLSEHDACATALWIIHAHAHDSAFHSPRLAITSPTPRCGKSSLLRTIGRLAPRAKSTSNISPAALFRVIEAAQPTLLCDEMDTIDKEKHREIVGIINSSHCRLDATITRTVGDQHEPRDFSTWAPIAIAAIGHLPLTWIDRSIVIRMKRRAQNEPIERMRLDHDQGFTALARRCARWAVDHGHALSGADPATPPQLNDRASDHWRHMLAIADLCGGGWPERARAVALALSTDSEGEAEALGVMLLTDLRAIFDAASNDALWTEPLVDRLKAMGERPWSELNRGKGITGKRLADMLRTFGVRSRQIKDPNTGVNKNGYRRSDFSEAWARYCSEAPPGYQSSDPLQATESATFSDFQSSTAENPVEDWNRPKATETAAGRVSEDWGVPNSQKRDGGTAREQVACAHCGESVEPNAPGTTVTSSGEYLHNACVDAWSRANDD